MKKSSLKVSSDKRFLSDVMDFLPSNCLLDKGITGCGGTTVEINSKRHSIICVPNISLVLNKQSDMVCGVYGKTSIGDIRYYLQNHKGYKKFIVVYDSLPKLLEVIGSSVYNNYFLLIDEYHILFNSYVLRNYAIKRLLNEYRKFDNFCFMTATPLDDLTILKELEDLPIINIEWEAAKKVNIEVENTCFVLSKLKDHITFSFRSDYNLHIFINSMKSISKTISDMNLEDYKIVCSEDSALRYKNLNCVKTVDDIKKINFYTSTCFEGVDIYDPKGKTIIISDSNISTTMLDISTMFVQICGRLRDSVYKNQVTFILNAKNHRYCKYKSYEEFEAVVKEIVRLAQKETENFIFHKDADLRRIELMKYCYETYSSVYLIKDEHDNILYDDNLKKIDLKNFDIVNNVYNSYYTVLDNVNESNLLTVSKTIDHNLGEDQIIKLVRQSFNPDKRYTYDEVIGKVKNILNSFGVFFKRNDIKKYIQLKRIDTHKNGKRVVLYQIIK